MKKFKVTYRVWCSGMPFQWETRHRIHRAANAKNARKNFRRWARSSGEERSATWSSQATHPVEIISVHEVKQGKPSGRVVAHQAPRVPKMMGLAIRQCAEDIDTLVDLIREDAGSLCEEFLLQLNQVAIDLRREMGRRGEKDVWTG